MGLDCFGDVEGDATNLHVRHLSEKQWGLQDRLQHDWELLHAHAIEIDMVDVRD